MAVVNPSTKPKRFAEPFGRVAVEAQAMEKPILASNIGGSNETIIDGQTGFLFKSDDEKDLAKNGKIYNSLKSAKKPVFIIGESGLSSNGEYVLESVKKILKENNFINNDWNGLNILHQNASSVGAIYLNLIKPNFLEDSMGRNPWMAPNVFTQKILFFKMRN